MKIEDAKLKIGTEEVLKAYLGTTVIWVKK